MQAVQCVFSFFFNDPAAAETYTLSLHDALPISDAGRAEKHEAADGAVGVLEAGTGTANRARDRRDRLLLADDPPVELDLQDRKSTRLNSSHSQISYAVFCLKKKIVCTPLCLKCC